MARRDDDSNKNVRLNRGIEIGAGWIAIAFVIYLVLNIIGAVYYVKMKKSGCFDSSQLGGALASVVIGWVLFVPNVNITSPIMYATGTGKNCATVLKRAIEMTAR